MSNRTILFFPHAKQRLEKIADYLYRQNLSKEFVQTYLKQFKLWLNTLLGQLQESGISQSEYGEGIRKIVYKNIIFSSELKMTTLKCCLSFERTCHDVKERA